MKLIFTSYVSTPEYIIPGEWLKRIDAYTRILESLSNDHTVIGIERINYEGAYEKNGVQYLFIRLKQKTVRFPFRMHRLIKKLQPDIVFVNGFIFPLQTIQLRLKLGKAAKIIILHRGEKPYTGIRRFLQKLADKSINAYLFTSAEFGATWIKHGNISNQNKIHEIIQASSVFYPQERSSAKSILGVKGLPVFLWVGRLDVNKDPVTVVKAFSEFLKFQPGATLYMIYHTEMLLQEVSNLIKSDSKASTAIKLVGKIQHDDLQAWFNAADFIISGSHHEGSGVAVCEGMSCGCIPVITDIISFRKMTGPGKCGLLYKPGDDKDLLAALLKTRDLDIETESAKALQQFKDELSFEAIAKKINKVINSC